MEKEQDADCIVIIVLKIQCCVVALNAREQNETGGSHHFRERRGVSEAGCRLSAIDCGIAWRAHRPAYQASKADRPNLIIEMTI